MGLLSPAGCRKSLQGAQCWQCAWPTALNSLANQPLGSKLGAHLKHLYLSFPGNPFAWDCMSRYLAFVFSDLLSSQGFGKTG